MAVLLQGGQQQHGGGMFPPVVLGGSTTHGVGGLSGVNGVPPVEGVLVNGVRFRVVDGERVQVEKGEGGWEDVKNKVDEVKA